MAGLGAILGPSWVFLGHLGLVLASSGRSWALFGAILGSRRPPGPPKSLIFLQFLKIFAVRPCCLDRRLRRVVLGHFGLTFGFWRAIWGRLGAILASARGRPGPTWRHLGRSWRHLGRSWGHLGAILGPSWPVLGPSWAILAGLGAILGPSGAILGPSWAHLGLF